jgi:hypothetical protein
VVGERKSAARAPFVLLVAGLLAGGLVLVLLVNTWLAQGSFTLRQLQQQQSDLRVQSQALAQKINTESAPQVLAAKAQAMGMVPAPAPVFKTASGKVLGRPEPGVAPPPPQPPSPSTTPSASTSPTASASASGAAQASGKPSPQASGKSSPQPSGKASPQPSGKASPQASGKSSPQSSVGPTAPTKATATAKAGTPAHGGRG